MTSSKLMRTAAVLIAVLCATSAAAQNLDGTWLRLAVVGRGVRVDLADDSARANGVFRGRCYLLLKYDSTDNDYDGPTACEIARNVWAETSGGPSFTPFSDDRGGVASNSYVYYTNRAGQTVEGAGTHILTARFNRRGVLRRVLLSSYGEIHSNSTLKVGVSSFIGGYQVKGVSVKERRVPKAVVSMLGGTSASGSGTGTPTAGIANEILALVNAHRSNGTDCATAKSPVGPLTLNSALNASSERHALDMATNNFHDHRGSDGSSAGQRIGEAGFSGSGWGENIAAGYTTAAAVVDGWMTSPGHCNNIMNGSFAFLGAAHAFNASTTFGNYWVQNFGGS